jgi:hypothetical protein
MTKHQTARVSDAPAAQTHAAPATVVRFPLVLSVRRSRRDERRRPSVAINLLLIVVLVLACVIWEAMSSSDHFAPDVRHTPITSSRAAAADDRGCAVV